MLRAIRRGEVDALVVQCISGPQVYTLQGQDAEANRIRGEMLAQVSDAVIAVDREERVIYLNPAAEQLYGFSASGALGRALFKVYQTRWRHPDDEAAAEVALRERGAWRGECMHVRQDGHEINVESGITVLRENLGSRSPGTRGG